MLAAALIAEGAVFGWSRWLALRDPPTDRGALILAGEVLFGAILPLVLLPRGERVRGYLSTLASASSAFSPSPQ